MKERIFPPLPIIGKLKGKYVIQNEDEVTEKDADFAAEMENHQPLCYYVMNNGCVEEQKAKAS